mmetsp:Transcript_39394/g.61515  ORF Transcript_39394/g.61515 Transcript_39394/m.61515 type:complete len:81 (+) Transcript_39394:142-384(+)
MAESSELRPNFAGLREKWSLRNACLSLGHRWLNKWLFITMKVVIMKNAGERNDQIIFDEIYVLIQHLDNNLSKISFIMCI